LIVQAMGMIGLGLLGGAMSERLLAGGCQLLGFDSRQECCDRLVEQGGAAAASSSAVLAEMDVIVLSLPDSQVVADVLTPNQSLLAGKLIIDTTTGDPAVTAELGRQLADCQAQYIDATVLGSSQTMRAGQALLTVGGDAAAVERAAAVLGLLSTRWFHVGPTGSGARMKLVVNLVLGLHRAVLAEGLTLARHCGFDLATVLEILRSGAAYSKVMDTKGRKMLEGDFEPEARLSQHLKDVRLILELAERVHLELPLTSVHADLLRKAEALGLGACDNSAVIRAFDTQRE
jgi:3-hydroxyisobutyrate dehydrogenase-like beta-hydroxyacid dehydrogenase